MAEPTTSADLLSKPPPAGVDPNVKIPKSVIDAGARSEAIQRAMTGEAEPSVVAPAAPDAPIQLPPDPPPPQHQFNVQPAPPVPQQQSPPVTAQPQVASQTPQQPVDWERNFHAMRGRYEKQTADMAAMGETLTRLQNELAAARSVGPAPNGHAPQPASLLTAEEVRDYGPEFIDVVRRAAAELTMPLQEEVQHLRSQLGSVQTETGNSFLNRMNATIGSMVPNWEGLNRDPSFVQWVSLPEVYSGVIRQQLMQDAWNNGDAQRVAAFFRAFLAEEAAVDPQTAATRGPQGYPPSPAPAPAAPALTAPFTPQLSLADLAAPGRAHSVAQMPADKPVYTAQDITRFYTDVAAGKWRTRDAERVAIDADILAAQREGRIIPDQRTSRPMGFSGGR